MLSRTFALAFSALVAIATPALADTIKVGDLEITNGWARATPPGATTAGAYFIVTNTGKAADTLTGISTPVAGMGMLHRMQMKNGIMTMRAVEGGIAIDPGKSVTLAPDGYHVMLMGLKQPLKAGGTLPLTLTFAKAASITLELPILPVGSKGPLAAQPATADAMPGMDMNKPMGN